ncbi:MAG: hypothetical protein IKW88_06020 [Clostridiales bacterium]|nr:hypothetical protein [Clostridiales bacterium]
MKKTIAKFLSMILVVTMMSGTLPAGQVVFAAEEETAVETEAKNDEKEAEVKETEAKPSQASKPDSEASKETKKEPEATEKQEAEETEMETESTEKQEPEATESSEPKETEETEVVESERQKPDTHSVAPKDAKTAISEVSVKLDAPKIGEKPDYTAVLLPDIHPYMSSDYSDGYGYFKNGIRWTDNDKTFSAHLIPSSSVFEEARQYFVTIYLLPKDGYSFTTSTTAKVNGFTAKAICSGDYLVVSYTFDRLPEYIRSVSANVDAPVIGSKPDFTAELPSDAKYSLCSTTYSSNNHYIKGVQWYDLTNSTYLDQNSTFLLGHRYKVTVYLKTENNYYFINSTTATINGEVAQTTQYDQTIDVTYTFPERIATVDITLDAPKNGNKPDYTATFPSGVKYYCENNSNASLKNDISWYDVTITNFVDPNNATFEAGHQYLVYVYLTAKDGYYFDSNTTATVNDQNATASLSGKKLYVSYTFPKNSSTYSFTINPEEYYYALESDSNPEPVIYSDVEGKCGSVNLSKTTVETGDVVTITVTSNPGYTLKKVTFYSVGYGEKDITSEMKFTVGTVQPYVFVYFQEQAPNTLSVAPKTAKVKYKKLKKKKQTVKRAKVMNVNNAQGNVTYKLTAVKRGKSKKYKKYFSINATTGNVTIKKKLKKGTYKVTCNVTAAGDSDHSAATKTVTFTIKVK